MAKSVLVFATKHYPIGGIESHLQEFCLNIKNSGVEVDLVILDSNMLPETEAFFRNTCRQVYLGKYGGSFYRLIWLLWVSLNVRFKHHRAVYTNGQGSSVNFFMKLLPSSLHWVHHHHMAGDSRDQATWGKGYYKSLLKADQVIACSKRNAEDMSTRLRRKINTVPCFSHQVEVLSDASTKLEKLCFGYYGRLIPEKGVDLLCQLSQDKDLQHIEFHLWGEGVAYPEVFFLEYPNIHYHGKFSNRESLTGVIGSLDALLLLSKHPEGLPICLLEAMSAGLPWLATNRGGIPDIVCDSFSTRVISDELNYNHVKAAVLSLAADIKAGNLSKAALKSFYKEKFSAPALVTKWHEVLQLA